MMKYNKDGQTFSADKGEDIVKSNTICYGTRNEIRFS